MVRTTSATPVSSWLSDLPTATSRVCRHIPTISLFPDIARAGGLLAYGPDIQDLFRQVGAMARNVLHGAKVAELPAERPTRFQLVANLRTAKLLGITLPPAILLRADEVIE
jgi:putative ABC transport system substrate-binding protein